LSHTFLLYHTKQFPWHWLCYGNITYKFIGIVYWRKKNPTFVDIKIVLICNNNNTTKQSATHYGKLLCRPHLMSHQYLGRPHHWSISLNHPLNGESTKWRILTSRCVLDSWMENFIEWHKLKNIHRESRGVYFGKTWIVQHNKFVFVQS